MKKVMIGLEGEMFYYGTTYTKHVEGDISTRHVLEIPPYLLPRDDFPLLVEVRGKPAEDPYTAAGNFVAEVFRLRDIAAKNGGVLKFESCVTIGPELYSQILRILGHKDIPKCKNIYGTDINEYSNTLVEDGKITGHIVSAGLHVHFSYVDIYNTYEKDVVVHENKVSLITPPVIHAAVRAFDKHIFPRYSKEHMITFSRYRFPGFYEEKVHGFEYRSIPMSGIVYKNIFKFSKLIFETFLNVINDKDAYLTGLWEEQV